VKTVLEYLLGMLLVGGVLFLLVSVVFGRGEALAAVPPDAVPVELPEQRPTTADDIRLLRLPVVLRGYRTYEVDWVLDRLAAELDQRDMEIARLRAELAGERRAARAGGPYLPDAGGPYLPDAGGAHLPDAGGAHLPDTGGAHLPDAGGDDVQEPPTWAGGRPQ
jgi:DivIVA domain-containing protein